MSGESYPNFETLCRLCLQPESATISIFSNDATNSNLSIPVRIMACASLEVQSSSDGLPKALCSECRYQLEKYYYFRKRCQLSDNKLRRHMRLLSMGKKSRIFRKRTANEDDDFDDELELEFEDSLCFLQEADEQRKQQQREQMKPEIIEEYREQIRETCRDELRTEVEDEVREQLRQSVWQQVKTELRLEVREDVALEVMEQCRQQAKDELRDQLKEECRAEEVSNLLDDLKEYLKNKSSGNKRNGSINTAILDAGIIVHCKTPTASSTEPQRSTKKTSNESVQMPAKQNRTTSITEAAEEQLDVVRNNSINCKMNAEIQKKASKRLNDTLLVQTAHKETSTVSVSNAENDHNLDTVEDAVTFPHSVDEPADENDANFFVIDEEDDGEDDIAEDEEMDVEDEDEALAHEAENDNEYLSGKSTINYRITASKTENGTTYQIESNSNIEYFKDEPDTSSKADELEADNDTDVLLFDPDFESSEPMIEFIDIDKKSLLIGNIATNANQEPTRNTKNSVDKRQINTASISNPEPALILRSTDTTKTFQCPECPQLFTTEASMVRHMSMHRKLEQKGVSYQCPNCKIFLSCKSALKRHMLKHTGRRPFSCEECGKSFIQREILKRHLLTHSGVRPYKCMQCDRAFTQKINLVQHINKSHTENPKIQQFSCHLCPKRFNHASGLSRHLAAHSGVTFQCTECEREFTDRSSVKRHIMHVHGIGNVHKLDTHNAIENQFEIREKADEDSSEYII